VLSGLTNEEMESAGAGLLVLFNTRPLITFFDLRKAEVNLHVLSLARSHVFSLLA
jgi:hypothetical protein